MLRCIIFAAMLAAVPPALAWSPFGTSPSGGFVSVQDRNKRGESSRPSRDRQDAQRRQGERERNNTLTPDERRELNRDLQRANREFYRKGREGR